MGTVQLIPVLTPNFVFPTSVYFKERLPQLLGSQEDVKAAHSDIVAFFKTIAVTFSSHAGDAVLKAQSQQIVFRLANFAKDAKRTASANSQTSEPPPALWSNLGTV